MKSNRNIYLALPALNESGYLPDLLACLKKQDCKMFKLVVCVNQYDDWWNDRQKAKVCHDNLKSIELLKTEKDLEIEINDRSSKGKGWEAGKGGVGWARKVIMDQINEHAQDNDLIISIDADTHYPPDYVSSVLEACDGNPSFTGFVIPYYHKLGNPETDPLILRYEIYMRNYLLNMLRIENPYAFTAIGSAMAVPVWAYRKVGGITPVKSGEDFYFMQKLAKNGKIGIWADTVAYPSSRLSDRVIFGTGPALIKGKKGQWDSYPVYPDEWFDKIKITYDSFNDLFDNDITTPMDNILFDGSKESALWQKLRTNNRVKEKFIKACMIKVDGLRILQFLKQQYKLSINENERVHPQLHEVKVGLIQPDKLNNISYLKELRDVLFEQEMAKRKEKQYVGIY